LAALALLAGFGSALSFGVPAADDAVRGEVRSGGQPLAGAVVRVQTGERAVFTDADGSFTLPVAGAKSPLYVTVAKEGYYNRRAPWKSGSRPLVFDLQPIPPDNPAYAWRDPTPNPHLKDNCGNCHSTIYSEWSGDAHSRAAVNPLVLTLYNGTDVKGRPNGAGYRTDWPDFGNCINCHGPIGAQNAKQDLNLLQGAEKTGVSCDFCHKVQEVAVDPQTPAASQFVVHRPAEGAKLIFGPFDDATFPGEIPDFSYAPLFSSSRICAPCHEGSFFGVPIYETYSEWSKSKYRELGINCQDCHMSSTGQRVRFADHEKGGLTRAASRIGSHGMMGSDREKFIRRAVSLKVGAELHGELVDVTVEVANVGAGHDLPTGQPMRHLLLEVSCRDAEGKPLQLLSGERLPSWSGDHAGEVGKAYGKILLAASEYRQVNLLVDDHNRAADFPAPFWRKVRILSDNRIPAGGTDVSKYVFQLPAGAAGAKVEARLIYRRAYQAMAEIKGWNVPDLVLKTAEFTARPPETARAQAPK
jgi:hypothetical protein